MELKLTIASNRSRQHYNKSLFGDKNCLNENSITCFFTTIGVTTDEAEKWQPWAAAYVNMELDGKIENTITKSLRHAKWRAHAHINSDPKWVFKNLPPDCLRHYRPASSNPHISHVTQPEASLSTNVTTEPSSSTNAVDNLSSSTSTDASTSLPNNADAGPSTKLPMHPDAAEQSDVHLSYRDEEDEDTWMGLA
jgi:hypothetical protein